ncbi:MAG: MotA/TolQ/ExbB proton channel family protein [Planctomycetes bacterium]|nr:MotA/TolQ/ExbB proton channel family protein [Planctomycetota bacterium]
MPLTPSQRPTREWPLLLLTLAVVGMIVYPLWQAFASESAREKAKSVESRIQFLSKKVDQDKQVLEALQFKSTNAAESQASLQTDLDKKRAAKAAEADLAPLTAKLAEGEKQVAALAKEVREVRERLVEPDAELKTLRADHLVQRLAKLFLGPEQIACYCCFLWGVLIFLGRYWEVRRQRRAFGLGLLSTEEGTRILPEDARVLQRQVDQASSQRGPFILANMIRVGLSKLALSRSSLDVRETLKTQADVDLGRLISSMATMNYLAWAIPAIGFLGTVRGLAGSMTLAGEGGEQLRIATQHLTIAFDCTLVALALSLVSMFLIHTLQRDEESLVIDCQQYCLEHLVNRIYEPELSPSAAGVDHGMEMAGNGVAQRGLR